MPKKQEAAASTLVDVRKLRAATLRGFLALAEKVLTTKSGLKSLHLSCAQYYADEAGDAVHDSLAASKKLFPSTEDAGDYKRVTYEMQWKYLGWDSNDSEVYSFAPLCNEEGWSEDGGEDYEEGGTASSLVLVQRVDGNLRPIWLGALHRPWLDFPGAMKDRDGGWEHAVEFADDPPAPALQGKEQELYAQVLADPTDLGAREVLRDVWMLRNDPRGEFSALSTTAKLTDKLRARAGELVLEHGRSWLGPLQSVIPLSGSLFGNGPFLRKAIVYGDAKTLAKVGKAAEWATVEEITFANQSHRLVTRAMKNLRAVGPLSVKELAQLHEGTWRIEDLDVEVGGKGALEAIAKLRLPLQQLRLRADAALDLKKLAKAAWWSALERIELWLPGNVADAPAATERAFMAMAPQLPAGCTLAVGQLSSGQRSGWMLAGTPKQRRVELHRPDARFEQGPQLAAAVDAKLPSAWTYAGDDWLTFGLGVAGPAKRT